MREFQFPIAIVNVTCLFSLVEIILALTESSISKT